MRVVAMVAVLMFATMDGLYELTLDSFGGGATGAPETGEVTSFDDWFPPPPPSFP